MAARTPENPKYSWINAKPFDKWQSWKTAEKTSCPYCKRVFLRLILCEEQTSIWELIAEGSFVAYPVVELITHCVV